MCPPGALSGNELLLEDALDPGEPPHRLAVVDGVPRLRVGEVLQDGDLTLWESMAINLYLARRYDKALWPKRVEDEGRAFQWSLWAMTELEEPVLTAVMHRMSLPADQRDPKRADDSAERFMTPLGVLNGALAGKAYLLGDAFTVADLNVASVISSAPLGGLDLGSAPGGAGLGRALHGAAGVRARAATRLSRRRGTVAPRTPPSGQRRHFRSLRAETLDTVAGIDDPRGLRVGVRTWPANVPVVKRYRFVAETLGYDAVPCRSYACCPAGGRNSPACLAAPGSR